MTIWWAFFCIYIRDIKFIGCAVCFNWAIERKRAVAFKITKLISIGAN